MDGKDFWLKLWSGGAFGVDGGLVWGDGGLGCVLGMGTVGEGKEKIIKTVCGII